MWSVVRGAWNVTANPQIVIGTVLPAPAKVLLVEDDLLIAIDLADIVREIGADVLGPCSDASDAIGLLASCRPDAALIDYGLAHGCAEPIARALTSAGVPFAVVTGYCPEDLIGLCSAEVPIVEKPFSLGEIRTVLRALVRSGAA